MPRCFQCQPTAWSIPDERKRLVLSVGILGIQHESFNLNLVSMFSPRLIYKSRLEGIFQFLRMSISNLYNVLECRA